MKSCNEAIKENNVRIGIVGPGALGCLFGARLFLSGDGQGEILLIDHSNTRAAKLNKQGILYESDTGTEHCPIAVTASPESIGYLDVLLSCVKSHDLKSSLSSTAPLIGPDTLLLFLQNGISHLAYDGLLPSTPAYATSSEGATCKNPGHIRHGGKGHTHLGFLAPVNRDKKEQLEMLATRFNRAGIECSTSKDITTRIWAKLFVNVGINGLTAVYNRTNGQLLTSCAARSKIKALVREAESVAAALGVTIKEDPVKATLSVCKRTSRNTSSMLQDVHNRRPTEIDSINGAISRLGKENNIPTPVNDALITQIKTIEKKYLTTKEY